MTIDRTHDAEARSWVASADDHADFPVQNLPLGVYSLNGAARRIGTIIGDWILDSHALASAEALPLEVHAALRRETLNDLFARPSADRVALRHALFGLLTSGDRRSTVEPHLYPATGVTLHLPFAIGDYTDFGRRRTKSLSPCAADCRTRTAIHKMDRPEAAPGRSAPTHRCQRESRCSPPPPGCASAR